MILLFVFSVMNLLWAAALTGFVLIEKVASQHANGRSWPILRYWNAAYGRLLCDASQTL